LHLTLAAVLITTFALSESAYGQVHNPCTSANPCDFKVCGDHVCAPGEFQVKQSQMGAAQRGNFSSQPSYNMTAGNMTVSNPSTGTILAGVYSYEDVASDGTIVIVRSSHPIVGQPLTLGIGFFGPDRNPIHNQNYAISITQGSTVVLSNPNRYSSSGIDALTTTRLPSSDMIGIKVTLNGIGLPSSYPATWSGLKGETLSFSQTPVPETNMTGTNMNQTNMTAQNAAVPEFGTISTLVLTISIISIMVYAAKTRIIPKLD